MSRHKQCMLDALMHMGGRQANRVSWTTMVAAGALIYFGANMLR